MQEDGESVKSDWMCEKTDNELPRPTALRSGFLQPEQ